MGEGNGCRVRFLDGAWCIFMQKGGINIQNWVCWLNKYTVGKVFGGFLEKGGVRKYENSATDCCYFFEQKNKRTYILCVVEGDGDK